MPCMLRVACCTLCVAAWSCEPCRCRCRSALRCQCAHCPSTARHGVSVQEYTHNQLPAKKIFGAHSVPPRITALPSHPRAAARRVAPCRALAAHERIACASKRPRPIPPFGEERTRALVWPAGQPRCAAARGAPLARRGAGQVHEAAPRRAHDGARRIPSACPRLLPPGRFPGPPAPCCVRPAWPGEAASPNPTPHGDAGFDGSARGRVPPSWSGTIGSAAGFHPPA